LIKILSFLNDVLKISELLSIIDCHKLDIGMISPSKQAGLISFPIVPRIVLIPIHSREVAEDGKFLFDSLLVNPGTELRGVTAGLPKKMMSALSFVFFFLGQIV